MVDDEGLDCLNHAPAGISKRALTSTWPLICFTRVARDFIRTCRTAGLPGGE